MSSKARGLADLGNAYDDGALSNRNLIINGAMQVAQRGTSVSGATGFYSLDRWRGYSASSFPITQESFVLGQTDVPNEPKNYLRVGTGAAVKALSQRIEGVRTGAGQTLTLSFYAKASAAFNCVMGYTQSFGTGGSPATGSTFDTLSITTSWQKFEATFSLPSISGKTIGTADMLQITFADAGTYIPASTTFDLAQVQLEVGDTATPFEHRSYGDELARCQRYYQRIESSSGISVSANYAQFNVPFPVEMRATPSASISDVYGVACARITDHYAADTTVTSGATISLSNGSKNGARVQIGPFSGLTSTRFVGFLPGGSYSSFMRFDAEL